MIYEKTNNFYNQKIHMITIRQSRFNFITDLCNNKKVLHIGCSDYMVLESNVENNLHIFLSKNCIGTTLHGLDIEEEATNKLAELCPGTYYTKYDQVKEDYNIIIVPEVLEHVSNVGSVLNDIFSINSNQYLFTVPSAHKMQLFCDDQFALEMVHPDHKYWFSPYTLYNILKPFRNNSIIQMFYLENKAQICALVSKPYNISMEKNDVVVE